MEATIMQTQISPKIYTPEEYLSLEATGVSNNS